MCRPTSGPSSVLNKRLAYLGIADFDYLTARLLLLHGLANTGLPKAAEAFEKILKLFLVLDAKITRNEELTARDLKKFGHRLTELFNVFKARVPNVQFPREWDEYFALLESSYQKRYPEAWESFRGEVNLHWLDAAYTHFRNSVVLNFPEEDGERVRHFGTFLSDAYTPPILDVIAGLGGRSPGEVLRLNNESFRKLNVDTSRL